MKTLSAIALSCAFAMAVSPAALHAGEREDCAVELLQKYVFLFNVTLLYEYLFLQR